MFELIIFFLIILFASILQTSSGFGFSIIATPLLLVLFSPQEAIQINILLSLVISFTLIWKIRQDVDFSLLKKIVIGSLIGAPFGSVIFLIVNIITFKLIIAITLIGLTVLLIKNWSIQPTTKGDYGVGFLSGLLTTSIGMAGPPLLLYFAGTMKSKEMIRATTLAYYIFIYLISLLFQLTMTGTNKTVWVNSLYALPILLIGLVVGQIFFNRLDQKLFSRLIYMMLFAAGVVLLIQTIFAMF